MRGLSPRIRGNRAQPRQQRSSHGSIPAHTGEPGIAPSSRPSLRVYPRAYGGTSLGGAAYIPLRGLSPRIRGNRRRERRRPQRSGSIPAHTGEPVAMALMGERFRVYPRAYGGTPSSRTRAYGSGVYPRAYGGTRSMALVAAATVGLSPRIRGNHVSGDVGVVVRGSIPAHTGEPRSPGGVGTLHGVYPRAYGGTRERVLRPRDGGGLSPRIRGNPRCTKRSSQGPGSIPAHTGEPSSRLRPRFA